MTEVAYLPVWRFAGWELASSRLPRLMGILNVTPDSFSDGGRFIVPERAVEHGLQLIQHGADLLDVGGESTRPGSDSVSEAEELRRVVPVIQKLSEVASVPISVDTTKSAVAREALAAGASIVNDISALTWDPQMVELCAGSDCGVIAMHMQGTPQTMQFNPEYEDAVREIATYLRERIEFLRQHGISPERVVIDPGIGFGKTAAHNLEILSQIAEFRGLGRPVLIGHSRKRFLGKLLGRKLDELTSGTIGVAIALAEQGTEILRIHDVAAVKDALLAWQAVRLRGEG